MKKKKILAVLMGVILTSLSLYGCGSSDSGQNNSAPAQYDVGGSYNGAVDGSSYDFGYNSDYASWTATDVYDEAFSENWNTEEYNSIREIGYQSVANSPLSTFSVDVDTASYSNLRRMIEDGYNLEDIPAGAVRIEEMLNYFSYDYNLPDGDEPFGVTTVIGDCPWNEDAKLLQIGMKTEEIDFSEVSDSNLVFLLDVSGSMYSDDKLPLLQRSFALLVEE